MNNTLFKSTILCALVLLATAGFCQDYVQVTTNPSSLIFGVFKAEVEIPVGNNWALETELSLLSKGQRFWIPDYNTKGYRAGIIVKKYFAKAAPGEGYYGFGYLRNSNLKFTDYVDEGQNPDQNDFERNRITLGFGMGYTKVGKDGFTYGYSLGIGRHIVDEKNYGYNGTNGVSKALDEEVFSMPIDVYGRVYVGFRLFNPDGLKKKEQYDAQQEAWEKEQYEILQNTIQSNKEIIIYPNDSRSELELRRLRHRLRNGNG